MIIRSLKTMTLKDQPMRAIHLHHLLAMQSLYRHHQQTLAPDYWAQQGHYPYPTLWQALIDDPDALTRLQQSDLIVIVYQSHEYNPRHHLAGVIEHSSQIKALVIDILDCGPVALGMALLMANSLETTHPNISILLLEQKTQAAAQATSHDATCNHISLLSNITCTSLQANLTVNRIVYNNHQASLDTFKQQDADTNPICISNRSDLKDQLNNKHRQLYFNHGYAGLIQHLQSIIQTNSKATLWIHLMGHHQSSNCCLWLDLHQKRTAS